MSSALRRTRAWLKLFRNFVRVMIFQIFYVIKKPPFRIYGSRCSPFLRLVFLKSGITSLRLCLLIIKKRGVKPPLFYVRFIPKTAFKILLMNFGAWITTIFIQNILSITSNIQFLYPVLQSALQNKKSDTCQYDAFDDDKYIEWQD